MGRDLAKPGLMTKRRNVIISFFISPSQMRYVYTENNKSLFWVIFLCVAC